MDEKRRGRRRTPPPLTSDELQELNRTMESATGWRLLWEIYRLRAIVLRANQLEGMVRDDRRMINDASVRLVIDILRQDLDLEPVVKEEIERQERLLLRKSGGPRI
jgi:hypothetical protein